MISRPPYLTPTDPPFPYTTLFRSPPPHAAQGHLQQTSIILSEKGVPLRRRSGVPFERRLTPRVQARPARSIWPPLSVPAMRSAASARQRKRASAARHWVFVVPGLRGRKWWATERGGSRKKGEGEGR